MPNPSNPKHVPGFRKASLIGSLICLGFAVLVLIGWFAKIDYLRNPIPGQIPVAPILAVFISFSALSTLLFLTRAADKRAQILANVLAGLVSVGSFVILMRFVFHYQFDLEVLLFGRSLPEVHSSYLARTAPTEANAAFLGALSLLFLGRGKAPCYFISQLLAALMALLPFFALVGYGYEVPFFYGVAAYTQMSMETAVLLLIFAVALFFAEPDIGIAGLITSSDAGGVMLRRLLPATILIPLLYGWLKICGQRLGLFERDFGTTLLILVMIVSTNILLVLNAKHLNDLDAERERLLEQRDNVMAVLTHDLKSPLIGADRVLELFVTGALGQVSSEQGELLSKLKKSNQELLNNIQNLLELYRYDRGAQTLRFSETDLLPILSKCLEELKPQIENCKLKVRLLLPEQLTLVKVDATAIKHVFFNLIQNAIKFTPEGGEIEISAQEPSGVVIVKVKDTGKGIPREEQESLFKPFSRGTLGKKYKTGTGLGLYLCYQIVKAHHGVLTCISEDGAGTTFVVSLPTRVHALDLMPPRTEKAETT
jgi:signal transduction histidine kinase